MPSRFGCSPGTYGDRPWTTGLQKRLMICDPTAELVTVGHARSWRKSPLSTRRRSRGEHPTCATRAKRRPKRLSATIASIVSHADGEKQRCASELMSTRSPDGAQRHPGTVSPDFGAARLNPGYGAVSSKPRLFY